MRTIDWFEIPVADMSRARKFYETVLGIEFKEENHPPECEMSIFPYSEPLHWATEPFGPDGQYGKYLTYLLVTVPLGWLVVSSLMSRRSIPQQTPSPNPSH